MFEWQDHGKWQLAEYMGRNHIRSCASLESSTCWINDSSLQVFLFFRLLLEVLSYRVRFFFPSFCVCFHVYAYLWQLRLYQFTLKQMFSCGYTENFLIFSIAAQYQDRYLWFSHHYFSGIGPKHKHKQQKKITNWKLINFPELL